MATSPGSKVELATALLEKIERRLSDELRFSARIRTRGETKGPNIEFSGVRSISKKRFAAIAVKLGA